MLPPWKLPTLLLLLLLLSKPAGFFNTAAASISERFKIS
jgi:hypothetical protein